MGAARLVYQKDIASPMRTLTLLRHAKSSWDDPVKPDFDRPLNKRGRAAAERMGAYILQEGLRFDHIWGSPAVRVRETIDGVETGLGAPIAVHYDRRLYMASAANLLGVVHETPDSAHDVLLIGHNPGLEELLLLLTEGRSDPRRLAAEEKYPTAALARLEFAAAASWGAVGGGDAVLDRFVRPRDLDPTLSPPTVGDG